MLKKYTYRSHHGTGDHVFTIMLDEDHRPVCFDTFYEWVLHHIEYDKVNMAWKMVHEEEVVEQEHNL